MVDKKVHKNSESAKNGYLTDPMALTWTTNYSDSISKVWKKLPKNLNKLLVTVAIFIVGISVNGDWINIAVHFGKQFGYISRISTSNTSTFKWSEISLESLKLQNLWYFCFTASIVSYSLYFSIGGFLHWYFYVRQRDRAEEWKCQPNKWLSPELEMHEIILGSSTLFVNSILSGILSCYIYNGGYSTVYYDLSQYGWFWFFLQWPIIFIYEDYITYWIHRMYHTPFLYKHFHKMHHKYKQPTAFSVTAIHPVESLNIQLLLSLPLFLLPIHWFSFYAIAIYVYYHGIIDHSGVNFKAYWWQPWQPDAIFHDNHHQYFHVNFAFNIYYWDMLHGTYRKKDRVYTENTFYGKGKAIDEVSAEELKADLEERKSENPLAYRENKLEFELTERELETIKRSRKNKCNEIN